MLLVIRKWLIMSNDIAFILETMVVATASLPLFNYSSTKCYPSQLLLISSLVNPPDFPQTNVQEHTPLLSPIHHPLAYICNDSQTPGSGSYGM